MKLRNKKTREIKDYCSVAIFVNNSNDQVAGEYYSIKELNENWEDYIPPEPLIKDEKIRKAVRAWGDMNQIREAAIQRILIEPRGFEDSWFQISGEDANNCIWKIEIHAPYSETVSKDYKENMVTIAELCGEEE